MPWIQTYTGRVFDYDDPGAYFDDPQACLTDICQSLSLINRYLGHTKFPYSVAHHSLNLAKCVIPDLAIHALLHDCEEAYIGDVPAPLKYHQHLGDDLAHIRVRVYACLGIRYPSAEEQYIIRLADTDIRRTERYYLMTTAPIPWPEDDGRPALEYPDVEIIATNWEVIRHLFYYEIIKYLNKDLIFKHHWFSPSI